MIWMVRLFRDTTTCGEEVSRGGIERREEKERNTVDTSNGQAIYNWVMKGDVLSLKYHGAFGNWKLRGSVFDVGNPESVLMGA